MALNLSGDGDSGRLAAWGTLAVAAAAASFCAVERPRGMGLGARVAACCLLGPYGGGGGCCWAAAGPAKILGSRAVEAAGLPLKCAQL